MLNTVDPIGWGELSYLEFYNYYYSSTAICFGSLANLTWYGTLHAQKNFSHAPKLLTTPVIKRGTKKAGSNENCCLTLQCNIHFFVTSNNKLVHFSI